MARPLEDLFKVFDKIAEAAADALRGPTEYAPDRLKLILTLAQTGRTTLIRRDALLCYCHSGSVCSNACLAGRHHDGCYLS